MKLQLLYTAGAQLKVQHHLWRGQVSPQLKKKIRKHINLDSISGRKDLVAFGSTSESNEPILTYSLANSFVKHEEPFSLRIMRTTLGSCELCSATAEPRRGAHELHSAPHARVSGHDLWTRISTHLTLSRSSNFS